MNVLTKPQKNNLFKLTNVVSNIDVIQGFHKKENCFKEIFSTSIIIKCVHLVS